jgi:F0F1-type ATP synthase assembly protein I
VLGAVVGYFAGHAVGNPAWGIILGTLAGAAILYRINPGPPNRR